MATGFIEKQLLLAPPVCGAVNPARVDRPQAGRRGPGIAPSKQAASGRTCSVGWNRHLRGPVLIGKLRNKERPMKIGKIGGITAAALMASAAVVYAQSGGGAGSGGPSGGATGGGPGGSGGVMQQHPGGSGGMQQPGGGTPGGMQQPGRQEGRGTFTGPRQGGGVQGSDKGMSEETQRGTSQKNRQGEQHRVGEPRGGGTEHERSGETKEGSGKGQTGAETQKGAGGGVGVRPQLSSQERTRIRTALKGGPRVNNLNVSLSVGTRLPRTVTLRPLPVTVIEIVPQYRGYDYVLVGDTIVIVDPATFAIVAVLEA
jgi:hypothetical protein